MTISLEEYRQKIDNIDRELLKLLNQRAQCNLEIGKIKKEMNQEVFVPGREQEIFENLSRQNTGPLSKEGINHIFQEILKVMKELQQTVLD